MNARDALEYLDERLIEHYATPFDGIRDALATLRACVEALEKCLPMLDEYKKWLIDDAIARSDVLEGPAWDDFDADLEQARTALKGETK